MALPIIGAIAGKVIEGVSGWAKTRAERKKVEAEGDIKIAQAKIDYKVQKWQSRAAQVAAKEQNDTSYDMQVLRNRETTLADELLIGVTLVIWIMHFIPYTQPYMAAGWQAMGYPGVPWWFEFVMLGIFISTLGLMRLFRLFWTRKTAEKQQN